MGAALTEVLMALGDWSLDLEWDPGLLADIKAASHVVIEDGADTFVGVLLKWRPGREGITIRGRSCEYELGLDDDGPIIEDREFLACTNRLSNPGFEIEDTEWLVSESTKWAIRQLASEPRTGSWAAVVTADLGKDDVLASDERSPARPGHQHRASCWVRRPSGTVGRIRLRTVYEGRYDPPQLLTNPNFEGGAGVGWGAATDLAIVTDAGNAKSGTQVLRCGPSTRLQKILNPSFESSLNNWKQATGTWAQTNLIAVDGSNSVTTAAGGPAQKTLEVDNNPGVDQSISVVAGERYRLDGWIRPAAGADGVAYIYTYIADAAYPANPTWIYLEEIKPQGGGGTNWRYVSKEIEIPTGKIAIVPMCEVLNHTAGGGWYFDLVRLTRLVGNIDKITSTVITVVPEQSYRLLASIRSGPNLSAGTLKLQVKFTATGRPDVIVESQNEEKTENTWKLLSLDATPPSGYSTAVVSVVATDIIGDYFWVDDMSFVLTNETEMILDVVSSDAAAAWVQIVSDTTAPAGTEWVRMAIVAESQATGWVVDDASFARRGTPAVSSDVVRELLKNPDTGQYVLTPGSITGTDALVYDWWIRYLTLRQGLKHLSRSGVVSPTREWRIRWDATLGPVLDWGTATELFVDRTEMVLVEDDLVLLTDPEIELDQEDRLTRVKAIGAERQTADGRRVIVTGDATNAAGSSQVDWSGRARNRTRIIEDSTLDHRDYATSKARYEADQRNHDAQAVRLGISDWSALGSFNVGDWIHVYKPEADLQDLTLSPRDVRGRTVFPKKVRVLSRTRRFGAGVRAYLRRAADGALIEITSAVRWEQETTAELEVGDLLPEFTVDPQGGAAGLQFRRFRASMPTR